MLFLMFAATIGPAGAEGTVCQAVAKRVQPNAPPPASLVPASDLLTSLGADLDAQKEADVVRELRQRGATPALMAAVEAQATCETCGVTLTWFANDTAGIVRNEAGDMHCVATTSFRSADGHLAPVALPAAFSDECPSTRLLSGRDDRPVFLAQESIRPSTDAEATNLSVDSLILSRWDGAGWERPCELRVTFSKVFFESHLNCADGFDCSALRDLAIADAATTQKEQRTMSADAITEMAKRVMQFAGRYVSTTSKSIDDTDRFPDFKTHPHKTVFLGREDGLDGTGAVKAIRTHPIAAGTLVSLVWEEARPGPLRSDDRSWVVTQWLERADSIRPVAGFVVHQKPGRVITVSAGLAG